MATRIWLSHDSLSATQRWTVEVSDADLTSWPRWRVRQLRRGLDLVRKALAGEQVLTEQEKLARALRRLAASPVFTGGGQLRRVWRSPRERLEAEIKADLDYGRD